MFDRHFAQSDHQFFSALDADFQGREQGTPDHRAIKIC